MSTAPSPSTPVASPSTTRMISVKPSHTRKSMKKYFPMGAIMSKGTNNPITVHSVNNELFAGLWSCVAEIMIADGELTRYTRESVAALVSARNRCPICILAHGAFGSAAKMTLQAGSAEDSTGTNEAVMLQEQRHNQAMAYAEMLLLPEKCRNSAVDDLPPHDTSNVLSDTAKAEVAAVVLLFNYMNRVVSAVLGEEMTTAMFSVPRSAAKKLEGGKMRNLMTRMMSPLMARSMRVKYPQGLSSELFPAGSSFLDTLPERLAGLVLAGEDRANAVARLVAWADLYGKEEILKNVISKEVLELLEDPNNVPSPEMTSIQIAEWATGTMREKVQSLSDETDRSVFNVLLLLTHSPQSVFYCTCWRRLIKIKGKQEATTLVMWWSLRLTFQNAQGLGPSGCWD